MDRNWKKWSPWETMYLTENYIKLPFVDIAFTLRRAVSAVRRKAFKLGIVESGNKSKNQFKKGDVPFNKGMKVISHPNSVKTQFKKGIIPLNRVPVGTIRFRKSKHARSGGYYYIKVQEPGKWQQQHQYLWVQEHGKVPMGFIVVFIDGDQKNCVLANLELISLKESALRNMNREKAAISLKKTWDTARIMAKYGIRNSGYAKRIAL